MRICIISPYFTSFVKGSEHGLAQAFTELGQDVTIVTTRSKAPREKMVADEQHGEQEEYNYKVRYLKSVDFDENPIAPSVFFSVLREKYDVVMLREDYPIMCHLAYLAAKMKRTPLTLSTDRTYSLSILSFKGFFLGFLDLTINKLVRASVDAYVAHCTAAKDFVLRALNTHRDVKVIPIGVDTNFFKPVHSYGTYLQEGDFKILTIARLHPYKGLEYLIKAMDKVVKEKLNVKLYIKGKGEDRKKLEKLVKDLSLDKHVSFVEKAIPSDEMPELYAECDLYVQPSIIEPFGIAVLEAMTCGKPVIGTKTGGMLDTIVDGKTGFLIPPADEKALNEAILKLIKDDDLRETMGRNARAQALKYDWNIIAKRYLDVINEISNQTKR